MRLKRFAYDVARRVGRLPPATVTRAAWPYLVPGAARGIERRWERRLRRAPVVTGAEHAREVGLGEIEEIIGCSICGDERMRPLFSPRAADGSWRYQVVSCNSCGLLYRHPGIRRERLGDLYASGYSKFLSGDYEAARRRRYEIAMDAFDPLFAEGGQRRLLDFGCGTGLFMRTATRRGFDAHGVDLSPDSVEVARTHEGSRNARCGKPDEIPEIAAGGFDVVTMWSVLAHLTDPVDDVAMLRRLLAPGGVLLVLTVNANSLLLKAHGAGWNGFTRNHLKFFSPVTLPRLFERAGFPEWAMRPAYRDDIEAGEVTLSRRDERRFRRAVERGNQGNMLRAVAFADRGGAASAGLEH